MAEVESYTFSEGIGADRGNGKGYWYNFPSNPASLVECQSKFTQGAAVRFPEMGDIISQLYAEKSVLVEGQPGAGKSNFIQDLEGRSVALGLTTLRIAAHINAGTNRHAEEMTALVQEFKVRSSIAGGIFIIDNADYVGYKGHSRGRAAVTQFAQQRVPVYREAIEHQDVLSIATMHPSEWRLNHWLWEDPAIDVPANELLDAFKARATFEGNMSLSGIEALLMERTLSLAQAKSIAAKLHDLGKANYFHAWHADLDLLEDDPEAAIEEVNQGRWKRMRSKEVTGT